MHGQVGRQSVDADVGGTLIRYRLHREVQCDFSERWYPGWNVVALTTIGIDLY